MRAALLTIAEDAEPPLVAGQGLPLHQLQCALALGCERILCLGDGTAAAVIALRHQAEAAGARFQAFRRGGEIGNLLADEDELLVFEPELLPNPELAVELLGEKSCVLVLPADKGVVAGFERIDLDRAWAGALWIQGRLASRLSELPEDADAHSALLRIALQGGAKEQALPAEVIADGRWPLVTADSDVRALGKSLLQRRVAKAAPTSPGAFLASSALRMLGNRVVSWRTWLRVLVSLCALLVGGAVYAASAGGSTLAFGLAAAGALSTELAVRVQQLAQSRQSGADSSVVLRAILDIILISIIFVAVEGHWYQRLFPSLMLVGLLRTQEIEAGRPLFELLRDRFTLAALLCVASLLAIVEPAVMLAALAIIALRSATLLRRRG